MLYTFHCTSLISCWCIPKYSILCYCKWHYCLHVFLDCSLLVYRHATNFCCIQCQLWAFHIWPYHFEEFPFTCEASLVAHTVKRLPAMWETRVWSLGWDDHLEKEMATHSSTLAWKIPWTEEPGRLQSMGSQSVRYNWATSLSSLLHPKLTFEIWFGTSVRRSWAFIITIEQ